MGLTPHEYYCMSPLEFFLAGKGYNNKMIKQWEHTRQISYVTASTIPSKKRLPPIHRWMPLPTDKPTNSGVSAERAIEIFKKLDNANKRT